MLETKSRFSEATREKWMHKPFCCKKQHIWNSGPKGVCVSCFTSISKSSEPHFLFVLSINERWYSREHLISVPYLGGSQGFPVHGLWSDPINREYCKHNYNTLKLSSTNSKVEHWSYEIDSYCQGMRPDATLAFPVSLTAKIGHLVCNSMVFSVNFYLTSAY